MSLPLVGEIEDDYDPQQYTIDIYRDGQLLFSTEDYVLDLRLENPPEGVYELTVRIADEGGNPAEDSVRFEILPEGSEVPGDTDDTDAGTDATGEADVDESGCRLGGPAHTPGPALLLLLAALRRRSPTRRRERPR
ncbi:MAG: hypothetical protein KC636_13955 [Myxococcales bacterium]|nr:hypothetical protein [Myxococcales bacterium]